MLEHDERIHAVDMLRADRQPGPFGFHELGVAYAAISQREVDLVVLVMDVHADDELKASACGGGSLPPPCPISNAVFVSGRVR